MGDKGGKWLKKEKKLQAKIHEKVEKKLDKKDGKARKGEGGGNGSKGR